MGIYRWIFHYKFHKPSSIIHGQPWPETMALPTGQVADGDIEALGHVMRTLREAGRVGSSIGEDGEMESDNLPSGEHTKNYGKWPLK